LVAALGTQNPLVGDEEYPGGHPVEICGTGCGRSAACAAEVSTTIAAITMIGIIAVLVAAVLAATAAVARGAEATVVVCRSWSFVLSQLAKVLGVRGQ
jgi:hypothetical protein